MKIKNDKLKKEKELLKLDYEQKLKEIKSLLKASNLLETHVDDLKNVKFP